MKKNLAFVIFAAFSFISTESNSQNWLTTGNAGTDTSTKFVGTTDAVGLKIKTNNVDRVWVGTNGRVGINTNAPASNLDVVNNGAVTMGVRSVTAGATVSMDRGLNTANAAFAYKSLGTVLWNSGLLGNDNFTIRNAAGGNNVLIITPANNVGIGTGSPTQKLDVNGNINTSGNLTATGTVTATGGNSTNWNTAYGWGNHATAGYLLTETDPKIGSNSINYIPKWNGSALVSGNIYDNGNIGIGTTTPLQLLDITSTYAFAQIKATSGWAGLILDKANSTDNEYLIHRTAGIDKWVEGMIGSDNFSLRNWGLAADALSINVSNNYIGIGTSAPTHILDVQRSTSGGSIYNVNSRTNYVGNSDVVAYYGYSVPADGYGYGARLFGGYYGATCTAQGGAYSGGAYGVYGSATGTAGTRYGVYGYASNTGGAAWAGYFDGNTYTTKLMVNTTTPATGFAVSVDGKIICTEMKVQLKASWPDYVFSDDYKLLPLNELEQAIKQYKHLPDMMSAAEIDVNCGYEIGDMQQRLLKKIEELTLYVIDQDKAINQLKADNTILNQKLNALQK